MNLPTPNPFVRLALALALMIAACASPPPPPQPSTGTPPPAAMPPCPGASDGPSIVVNALEEARRASAANPSGPAVPVCIVAAVAHLDGYLPDSLVQQASA